MKVLALIILAIIAIIPTSSSTRFKNPNCALPHSVAGRCRAHMPSWSYNASSNKCVRFIYGGCDGNANRFPSKASCKEHCKWRL